MSRQSTAPTKQTVAANRDTSLPRREVAPPDEWSEEMAALLERSIVAAGVAPSASAALAAKTPRGWLVRHATAGVHSPNDPRPVSAATIYDLASVTKSVFAVSAARYLERQQVSLNTPLAELLPATRGSHAGAASLADLLSHRAGLEPHLELFAPIRDGHAQRVDRDRALLEAARARRPECSASPPPGGYPPVYSDLGYMLVAEALKLSRGASIDELIETETAAPLGVALGSAEQWHRALNSDPNLPTDIESHFAPTETVAWRGGPLAGIVHDENCWVLAGTGCQGHAGLFGQARSVCRFGMALLDACAGTGEWLGQELIFRLLQLRPGGSLRLGFDGKSAEGSSAGSQFSGRAFGHLGFTGTSYWCDPEASVVVALLTNRVCPTRQNLRIRAVRPVVHGALFALADTLRQ